MCGKLGTGVKRALGYVGHIKGEICPKRSDVGDEEQIQITSSIQERETAQKEGLNERSATSENMVESREGVRRLPHPDQSGGFSTPSYLFRSRHDLVSFPSSNSHQL
jgi:hypothetical protein